MNRRLGILERGRSVTSLLAVCAGLLLSLPAQAAIELTSTFTGPTSYTPGQAGTYTLVITNAGTTLEDDLDVSTNFPAGVSLGTITCTPVGTGSVCGTTTSGNDLSVTGLEIAAGGGSLTFSIPVTYASSMSASPLTVTATVTSSDATQSSAPQVSSTLQRIADLSVAKTSPATTYTPGSTGSFSIVVANAGPSDSSNVVLTDTAPTGMTISSWTCAPAADCPAVSGSGNISQTLALAAGETVTYTVNAAFASGLQTDPLVNTASLTVPAALNDPDTADQTSSVSLARRPVTDLQLAFAAMQPTSYIPGGAVVNLSYVVTNAGPSNVTDAVLPLLWGSAVESVNWSCSPLAACSVVAAAGGGSGNNTVGAGSGTGNELLQVALVSGASVTVSAAIQFDSGARSNYTLSPQINTSFQAPAPNPDPNLTNNTASQTLTVDRRADIRVTKTASTAVVNPNDSFTYEILVENLGPSDVGPDATDPSTAGELGVLLTDDFDDTRLSGGSSCGDPMDPCWEACTSDGGTVGAYDPDTCPVAVLPTSGDITNISFALKAGSSSRVVAYVRAGSTGTVSNTASVTLDTSMGAPVSEFTTGGGSDSSAIVVTIDESSDLVVTKTDGLTAAVSGEELSYTVTVANTGFVSANGVTLNDVLPLFDEPTFLGGSDSAGLVPGSIRWQCQAFGGACCNIEPATCGVGAPTMPEFEDAIGSTVDLPGQSRVEFTITGRIDPRAAGTLSNTASLSLPPTLSDPLPANNTDTDDDTVLVRQANLSVEKTLVTLEDPGGDNLAPFTLTYTIVVTNDGPSYGQGIEIDDALTNPNFDSATARWCQRTEADAPVIPCPVGSATGTGPLDTTVDLAPGESVAFELTVDTIATPTGQIANTVQAVNETGAVFSDSVTSSLIGQAELTVEKTVAGGLTSLAPGEPIEYVIRVQNEGPDDVFGATVADMFPLAIDGLTWSCQATTPVPGDIEPGALAGPPDTAGNAVTISGDGQHVYVLGTPDDSVFVFDRTASPGTGFGNVALLETETDGQDDGGDFGPTVTGMNGPFALALDPSDQVLYVLSFDAVGGPSLSAFSRIVDPASPAFGELSFLGSVNADLPRVPAGLAVTATHVYVSGSGDPAGAAGNTDPLIAIFERDPVTALPVFDIARLTGVPTGVLDLAADPAGDWLFAGGDSLQMYSIDPGEPGIPAGRLTPVSSLAVGSVVFDLQVAPDLPQLVARSVNGGAGQLVVIDYLDVDVPLLASAFTYTSASMTLPMGVGDPLLGDGGISIAPDGEHVSGVSAAEGVLWTFRRDPLSGGLPVFQELEQVDVPSAGINNGLKLAQDLVHAPDGRHLLVASGADQPAAIPPVTNPPLAVYARRAPDPLFAFVEQERNSDPGVDGLLSPNDVAASPDGAHVYAVSLQDNSLVRFNRFQRLGLDDDSLGQHLQFAERYTEGVNGISGLVQPRRVLISPDGTALFVTSEQDDSIAVFSRNTLVGDPGFGTLTLVEVVRDGVAGVDGIAGAQGMVMDPTSTHLYVAGSFESSIARFRLEGDGSLTWQDRVVSGADGVVGLAGVRDLAITPDGRQLMSVSTIANALVVFDRVSTSGTSDFGELSIRQALASGIGDRPMAVAIPGGTGPHAGRHVYVVGQNSNSLAVLRRDLDPGSSAFGEVRAVQLIEAGVDGGPAFMDGPRDVRVSPDGKRIYVAAEFSDSIVVFDRDLNTFSPRYGFASAVETRRDGVNGVDGLRQVRALTVTGDSQWVYSAGFGDAAVASFRLGSGSLCTAGGSGVIADTVDIGVGGTIEYRAMGVLRPDAVGPISNTAEVTLPENFQPVNPDTCTGGGDFCDTVTTALVPEGALSFSKTSDQVSVVAGDTAVYQITIQNAGPSSLIHTPGQPLTVSDPLDTDPDFVPGSAVWSCEATGSGSLEFLDANRSLDPEDPTSGPFEGLEGLSRLAVVPGSPGPWLVGASVVDDSISVFTRDGVTGELLDQLRFVSGDMLDGQVVDSLDGAQAVAVSADGAFLYVASRVSDSLTVFSLTDDGSGAPVLGRVQSVTGEIGLNQAVDLAFGDEPNQTTLYVAGANDDAIAVFARHPVTGMLSWTQSIQQGVGGVDGLQDVSGLLVRGGQLYSVSPTSARVALFDRDPVDGSLSWRQSYGELDLGVGLAGASDLVLDGDGRFMYVAASIDNRIVVLERDTSGGGTDGELALVGTVEQTDPGVNGLTGVGQLALTADDVHLYATSAIGSSVAWFVRDETDGSLNYAGLRGNEGSQVTGLGGATGLVVDEALGQVFVAGTQQAAIARFQRNADSFCPASGVGALTNVEFNIGAGGTVTFTIEVEVAAGVTGNVDNVATLVAARDPANPTQDATDSNVVSTIADLVITKDDGLRELDGLAGVRRAAGTNLHVYTAAPGDNAIGTFERNLDPGGPDDGELEFLGALTSGEGGVEGINGVSDLRLSIDGAHLYAVSPVDNAIATFARDPATGALDFERFAQNGVAGVTGLSGAEALALSPDDAHVYVAGAFAGTVAVFRRQFDAGLPDYGRLEFMASVQNGVGGVIGIGAPRALLVSPDGRHLYVAGSENDTLAVFERNRLAASAGYGQIEFVTAYTQGVAGVAGLEGIRDLAISADGNTVYALGSATGTLARFHRDPATGELTFQDFKQDGTSGTTGLTGARDLLLDDAAASLFVAGASAGAVVRFDVADDADPALDGALDFAGLLANGDPAPLTGGTVFGLEGVSGLFASPDGRHLYAAGSGRGALLTLQRTAPAMGADIEFQQILIDGLGGVAPGTLVEYVITVENLGPSDVPQARVQDAFPDGFDAVSWFCSAEAGTGAGCLGDTFSGDVDAIVDLPVGGRATIRASGTISAGATGRLVNTATIAAIGVQDPNLANNSATDDDTVLSPAADLVVTVDNGVTEVVPGDTVAYDVIVTNNGPSSVRGVFVEDVFPAAMYDTTWSCTATPPAGVLADPLVADALGLPRAIAISNDGRWAYVAAGNAVEAFRRDPLTGALSDESVYAQGTNGITGLQGAADLVLTGGGRFLFVAGEAADAIVLFERDTGTGALEFAGVWQDGLAGVEGLGGVNRLLVSPDGAWLYAAGAQDNALATFAINGSSGALTPSGLLAQGVDGVDGLNGITDMQFAAEADLVLVTADANQSLTTFSRNPASGALSFDGILFNDDLLGGPAEDALLGAQSLIEAGEELLVASTSGNRIGRFELVATTVDDVERLLPRAVGVIDATVLGAAFVAPGRMAFDPDRARVYVGGTDELLLLNLLGEQPELVERYTAVDHPVLTGVGALTLGPALRHLHTLGSDPAGEIGSWSRERGSRCPLAGTGDLGRQQVDIVAGGVLSYRVEGRVRANAIGTLDYTVSIENPNAAQELNPVDNTATDSDPLGPAPDLEIDKQLTTDPVVAGLPVDWTIAVGNLGLSDAPGALITDNPPVFPAQGNGILAESGSWSCEANAPLADPLAYPAPAPISALAMDPDSQWLYATSAAEDALLAFPLDPSGVPGAASVIREGDAFPQGAGQPDLIVSGLGGASAVAAASGGLHVYVTGRTDDSLVVFAREQAGDPLVYVETFTTVVPPTGDSVPGLRGARAVTLSPDERFVFVAGSASNAIAVFERDSLSGRLEFVERVADGIGTIVPEFDVIRGVSDLHVSALGTDLYAIAGNSEALSRFSINGETGILTFESVLRAGGGVPDLGGLRALAVAPGDTHLYALVDAGVAIFARNADGSLAFETLFDPGGGAADGLDLVVDGSGSRAYLLVDGVGGPAIRVFRRDWADGSLESWFSQPIAATAPVALLQQAVDGQLLLGGGGSDLLRFAEQALSRCAAPSETADLIATTVDLGVGGSSDFAFSAIVHPSARGTLDNTASVAPGIGTDPDPANNDSTASAPITVVSDIGVVKTGPAEAVAGTMIGYSITVTNLGPSDALGIRVQDIAPAELSDLAWTCVATPGSSCPASGSGAPDFAADVLVDGQLDILLDATIDPAFIGDLINVALLTPETGASDPTPADQRSEWITTVRAEADLIVDKQTLTDPVVAGAPVEYRVTVFNDGPSLAAVVNVGDVLPAALSQPTWTCTGADGAGCPASGTGAPVFSSSMPPGSSLEVLVTGLLDPAATGTLTNSASAGVAPPATDPDPLNNSATVIDPIVQVSDVALSLDAPLNPFDPGSAFDLPIIATLSNTGPSVAGDIVLDLVVSAPVTQTAPGCTQPVGNAIRCLLDPLLPGQTRQVELALTGLPAAPATLVVNGEATTSADDPDLLNNVDSVSVQLLAGIDLDVRLENGRGWLTPGEDVVYTLTVANFGSVDAPIADVTALVPVELLDPEWTCSPSGAASCGTGTTGDIVDTASIPSGDTVVYQLNATVDPSLDLSVPQSVVLSALAESSPPSADINPANNLAVDDDDVRLVMFADGFESPVRSPAVTAVVPDAATACAAARFEWPADASGSGIVLTGRAADGSVLFTVHRTLRGSTGWWRLATRELDRVDAGRWWPLAAPGTDVLLMLDGASAELRIDGAALIGPVGLREVPASIERPAVDSLRALSPTIDWSACGVGG